MKVQVFSLCFVSESMSYLFSIANILQTKEFQYELECIPQIHKWYRECTKLRAYYSNSNG